MKRLAIILFALLPLIGSAKSIKQLNHSIADTQSIINKKQLQFKQKTKLLKSSELQRAHASHELSHIQKKIRANTTQLNKLQTKASNYQAKLKPEMEKLQKELRSAYQLGREPYIKLALNQKNPNDVSRMLTYYQYLTLDRIALIKKIENLLEKIKSNQAQLKKTSATLHANLEVQLLSRKKLITSVYNRRAVVKSISHDLNHATLRLAKLKSDKQNLENTINQLEHNPWNNRASRFNLLKGKLTWPTKGRISAKFGTNMPQSSIKYNGVVLASTEGRPIHAIASGKIIFAKWMSGYGLLVIVDHGQGYMSLYGRNQNIYAKVGSVVKPGDIIASVGNSGGYPSPSLYFEIRHNAKALNPSTWCHHFA